MSDDDRALIGRRVTPVRGSAVPRPVESFDDITGKFEGEELRQMRRSKRDTDERIERLEVKHDSLVKVVTETRLEVANMSGKLDVLPELVDAVRATAERTAQREHVTFTAQVDVDRAKALDGVEEKKDRRQLAYKIAGGIAGGGVLIEILHRLGVL